MFSLLYISRFFCSPEPRRRQQSTTHPHSVSFSGKQYIFEHVPLVQCARGTRGWDSFGIVVVSGEARMASLCGVFPRPCRVEEAVRFPTLPTAVHRDGSRLAWGDFVDR
jgi:hypothetical protein